MLLSEQLYISIQSFLDFGLGVKSFITRSEPKIGAGVRRKIIKKTNNLQDEYLIILGCLPYFLILKTNRRVTEIFCRYCISKYMPV